MPSPHHKSSAWWKEHWLDKNQATLPKHTVSEKQRLFFFNPVKQFLTANPGSPRFIPTERLQAFVGAAKSENLHAAGFQFFVIEVLNKPNIMNNLPRMKTGRSLPKVYSEQRHEEVRTLRFEDFDFDKQVQPSFVTHLVEQGVDLLYNQELIGYASSKNTEIYTHVAAHKIVAIRSLIAGLLGTKERL